jgi:flavin reductase (DIM6/NTAB) family NADH-FMN oxidoreductase RutF/flavin-dependent dehydrogenase
VPRIGIVGAGQSGAQLALGLLARGYDVTLVSDRSPEEIRSGRVMSSQCMFDSALQTERALGLDEWTQACPEITGIGLTVGDESWRAGLDAPAQSVDQRVKCAAWMERFTKEGGDLLLHRAGVADLEELTRTHDLVIVATGKGELGRLFQPDESKSRFDRPQRALALTYVTGMVRTEEPIVSFTIVPGVGEYFTFPALTVSGPCDIMVFEGVPGGPMDCWDDVATPDEHLARSLQLLRAHFPREYERCAEVALTDAGGVLRGRITPTVRKPVAVLPSGRAVLGMGDAVVLNDPITGQGSNNAATSAALYLDSIVARGEGPFDPAWMQRTFDGFWRGWAQWVVAWTNSLLEPPKPHQTRLLTEAAEVPGLAGAIVNGFDDPRTFFRWWFEADEAERFLAEQRAAEQARFDPRAYRGALGQYATGVTVITARAPDGRRIGVTANSFASVSLDPPLVSWCPAKKAPSLPDLEEATHFAVNVLAVDQHHLSRQFSTPAQDKFEGVAVTEGVGGLPLLDGAVAQFQCRTVARHDAGDHVIFIGEVERYDVGGGEPLVFHSGQYRVATKHPDM